jgi:hypothetical protein
VAPLSLKPRFLPAAGRGINFAALPLHRTDPKIARPSAMDDFMLQIRNPRVDELATRIAALRGRNKTEVVLDALEREWERLQKETSLEERLRPLQDYITSHPKTGHSADKAFFDDLSDET